MNWGKWIVVSFVLFAAFIATLVTICMKQNVNLVSKDYYQDELKYQQHITRLENTSALSEKPEISLNQKNVQINFQNLSNISNGELVLFCPSNPNQDLKIKIEPTERQIQVPVSQLKSGMYHAKFSWSMDGKDFFIEKTINL